METGILNQQIVKRLGEEYQCIWLINAKTMEMSIFQANMDLCVPGSVSACEKFNSYPDACEWYIENCVIEADRARMLTQTSFDTVKDKVSDGQSYFVQYNRICDGMINFNQLFYTHLDDNNGGDIDYILLGFRNIDIRKKAERDSLTGLYTRQTFFEKAKKLLDDNPDDCYDLMISDIIGFKEINEMYGASGGDEILKWVGAFLAPSITDEVLVGRYGGDQFVVLAKREDMQKMTSAEALDFFRKVQEESGLPKHIVKYGIYEDVDHRKSIISLCDKAHMALNSIKYRYGVLTAKYEAGLKEEIESHRKIEGSMHQALEDEQFKVYYQPKHDAKSGKLIGAEALIRWMHPVYGFMPPADFIPLFEKNGFVVEIDAYVWKRTCRNIRNWQNKGINVVPISVNASKLTFEKDGLLMYMQKCVEDNIISPDYLHVEITETLMTGDVDSLIKKLTSMRTVGYKIELDDFGSGYSSINILSTLPIDVVKLDMSFMKQFGDPKRAKVLAACIKLAKDLGYSTVSEGVETKEQCDLLGILGVDSIQGYYYSRPLPEDEFERYLIENA